MMKKLFKALVLIGIGGTIYYFLEVLFRGYSHWAMVIVGGLAFFMVGLINENIPWSMPIINQALLGGLTITITEFISGIILNLALCWDIWDYSSIPFNVLGQICIPYSLLWCLLSIVCIFLDDFLRWKLFGEEKPHYVLK